MYWSRWYRSSRAESPLCLSLEFRLLVTTDNVRFEIGPPCGEYLRISSSNSSIALSATGFLLTFFILPTSMTRPSSDRWWSLSRDANPGAGSTRMTAGGPFTGRNGIHNAARLVFKVSFVSSGITAVVVKLVTVSLTTNIFWRFLLSTSAANDVHGISGGSSLVWLSS